MQTLRALITYNRWANARVFERCRGLDATALAEDAGGTLGSLERTLKHLVTAEDGYLRFITGADPLLGHPSIPALLAWYDDHDLDWFADRAAGLADEYELVLDRADADFLAGELRLPWCAVPLTRAEGIVQVVLHSTQHRAQVFSTLGDRGVAVPALDYPEMLQERAAGG